MKLPLSLLAPYAAFLVISLAQATAQSSPENPPHSMQQDSQPASLASSLNRGEQKLTGCIRSNNGKYSVESKLHKRIWLSGPMDFAPQTGHTVNLYGTYLNGSAVANGAGADQKKPAESSPSRQGNNFQVSRIEMVSDTCAAKSAKDSATPADHP